KVLFIIISIIFIPIMSVMHPQSQDVAIVRTLGIDKLGDGFEVTIVSYEPASTQSFKENYILVSAKGETISQALKLAGDYVGKRIGLAHLSNIFVSNQFAEENLSGYLDYLCRSYSINNATNVVCTNITAKEFLKLNLDIEASNSNQENNFIENNINFVNGSNTNLEDVAVSAHSPNKTALINVINVDNQTGLDLSGESTTSGESSTGGSANAGSGSKKEKKFLKNDGSVAVIVDGKKTGELERQEIEAFSFINKNFKNNSVVLNNYSDQNLKDATVRLETISKKVKFNCYFENGRPTVVANINAKFEIVEVLQEDKNLNIYTPKSELLSRKLKYSAAEKIKEDFYPVWQKIKSLNADPYDFYQLFNSKCSKEFKEYLNSLADKNSYIQNFDLILNINCEGC
ncbi:MAG: hypothetical protein J5779_00485, partial [Clostridia bacterium]|nr:hypothetical protein [Clostridia bacterium]